MLILQYIDFYIMKVRKYPAKKKNSIVTEWLSDIFEEIDHAGIVAKVSQDRIVEFRFFYMVALSSALAVLGLLQNSSVVIIGAVLMSPLASPILSISFALATRNLKLARNSFFIMAIGVVVAVFIAALVTVISPEQTLTSEILARTKIDMLDFMIAVFSGLAAGYAVIYGLSEVLLGAVIANALMSPIAVSGYGIAMHEMDIALHSFVVFVINYITMMITIILVAKLYGFKKGKVHINSKRSA